MLLYEALHGPGDVDEGPREVRGLDAPLALQRLVQELLFQL